MTTISDPHTPAVPSNPAPTPPAPAQSREGQANPFDFPFTYQGGGYWRRNGVPQGKSAETLHGDQVVEWIRAHVAPPSPSPRSVPGVEWPEDVPDLAHALAAVPQKDPQRLNYSYMEGLAEAAADWFAKRASFGICTTCDGTGEVFQPSSVPGDDGWSRCGVCGGSKKQPGNEEIAQLRGDAETADALSALIDAGGPAPLTAEELARVREALQNAEWAAEDADLDDGHMAAVCPDCNEFERDGKHLSGCKLTAALALLDRALPKEPKP